MPNNPGVNSPFVLRERHAAMVADVVFDRLELTGDGLTGIIFKHPTLGRLTVLPGLPAEITCNHDLTLALCDLAKRNLTRVQFAKIWKQIAADSGVSAANAIKRLWNESRYLACGSDSLDGVV